MALSVRTEVLSDGAETRHYRAGYEPEIWRRGPCVGSGGMGEVWQEKLVSGSSRVKVRAVKKISKGSTTEKKLQRELEIVLNFSNMHDPEYLKCFVGYYCWYQDVGNMYIAMEYFSHGDLQSYIDEREEKKDRGSESETVKKKRPGLEADAVMITAQVAQALQHMHLKGVVHRDLKPQNILVSTPGPNWHVKVADFGVSKSMQNTLLKTTVGTTLYKAPELYDKVEAGYTAAVDIWSLGAVAFCVRTGQPPFRSEIDIFSYKFDKEPFPTSSLASSSKRCREFIVKAMHKIPNQRPTIDQVIQDKWIRPSSNSGTTDSSSAMLHAKKLDTDASGSWGSFASEVDSIEDANGSSFTVQPFKGRGLIATNTSRRATKNDQLGLETTNPLPNPSLGNGSSSGQTARVPVQNAETIPFLPTRTTRSPTLPPPLSASVIRRDSFGSIPDVENTGTRVRKLPRPNAQPRNDSGYQTNTLSSSTQRSGTRTANQARAPSVSNRTAVSISPNLSPDVSARSSIESVPTITSGTSTTDKAQKQQKRRVISALKRFARPLKRVLKSGSRNKIIIPSSRTMPALSKPTSTTLFSKRRPASSKSTSTTHSLTRPTVSRQKKKSYSSRRRVIEDSEAHKQALKYGRTLMWKRKFKRAEAILQKEKDFWEWARGPQHKGAQAAARSLKVVRIYT